MSLLLAVITLVLTIGISRSALAEVLLYQSESYETFQVAHYSSRHNSGRLFVFDPSSLAWYAYQDGRLIRSGRASGGSHYCPDIGRSCRTPVGSFRVFRKGGANCRSNSYPLGRGGARMDYCMFFTTGYAIHGSNDVPDYNASHGCIRVLPDAARWLNQRFLSIGTKVIVKPY